MLRSMEMFALQAAMRLPREDMTEPTITNNIGELSLMILLLYLSESTNTVKTL